MRLRASVMAAAMSFGATACSHLPLKTPDPIRIIVLNMHAGKDAAGKSNLDAIASLIKTSGADLVLMQDVDPAALDTLGTKLNYAAAKADSGIAALARGFIGFNASIPLTLAPVAPGGGSPAPRAALAFLASLRTGQFAAINAQIDPAEGRVRDEDLTRISDAISQRKAAGIPFVVGGNFNATPDHPGLARVKALGLRDSWTECGSGDGFTYPSDKPAKRIDYLFLTGDLHCSAATVIDTQISDHRPLLVTLK